MSELLIKCVISGEERLIPLQESTTLLDYSRFSGCEELETVEIPEGIKIVGSYAFLGCKKLKNVRFPQSIKEIKFAAFYGCLNLKETKLPKGVKIGIKALPGVKIINWQSLEDLSKRESLNCKLVIGKFLWLFLFSLHLHKKIYMI